MERTFRESRARERISRESIARERTLPEPRARERDARQSWQLAQTATSKFQYFTSPSVSPMCEEASSGEARGVGLQQSPGVGSQDPPPAQLDPSEEASSDEEMSDPGEELRASADGCKTTDEDEDVALHYKQEALQARTLRTGPEEELDEEELHYRDKELERVRRSLRHWASMHATRCRRRGRGRGRGRGGGSQRKGRGVKLHTTPFARRSRLREAVKAHKKVEKAQNPFCGGPDWWTKPLTPAEKVIFEACFGPIEGDVPLPAPSRSSSEAEWEDLFGLGVK